MGLYDAWTYTKIIAVDTTSAGANVASTITDFPVVIRLRNTNFDFSQALSNGEDIRFASLDGSTNYPYEIERWIPGYAEVWVKVPSIAGNDITQFRMYWGNAGASAASDGPSTFSDSFILVDHAVETTPVIDSSGTSTGSNTAGSPDTGVIGQGNNLDAYGDYSEFTNESEYRPSNLVTGGKKATWSIWIKPDNDLDSLSYRQTLMSKGVGWGGSADQDWLFTILNGGSVVLELHDDTGFRLSGIDPGGWAAGTWYHVALVYDDTAGDVEIIVNGTSYGTSSLTPLSGDWNDGSTYPVRIGRHGALVDSSWFEGIIDEARIANVGRSNDWLKLDYETQQYSGTAVHIGETIVQGTIILDTKQSGSATIPGSGTTASVTVTAVDTSRTVLFFAARTNDDNPDSSLVKGQVINSTTIQFDRENNDLETAEIEWFLMEFAQGVSVQHINELLNSKTNTDVTISPVDTAKAFPLSTFMNSGATIDADDLWISELTSGITLNLRTLASNTTTRSLACQVIEIDDAVVTKYSGTTSTSGEEMEDITLSPTVDWAHALATASYNYNGTVMNDDLPWMEMESGASLTLNRTAGSGLALDYVVYTVEVSSSSDLQAQQVTTTIAGSTSSKSETIASVDTANTALMGSGLYQMWGGANSTSDASDKNTHEYTLDSSTQFTMQRATADSQFTTTTVQVLDFSELPAPSRVADLMCFLKACM